MIETKTAASSATAILTGLVTWALIQFVPVFHSGLPPDLAALLPAGVAWLLSSYAGYLAPHTHRPELAVTAGAPGEQIKAMHDYMRSQYGPPGGNVVITDEAAGTTRVYGPVAPDPPAGKATP